MATKGISDLVLELQEENERLQFLSKLFERAVKKEFGHSIKEVHRLIDAQLAYENKRNSKTKNEANIPPYSQGENQVINDTFNTF